MRKVGRINAMPLILIASGVITVFSIMVSTAEQIRQQTETIESERLVTINLVASKTELRIDDIVKTLQIASSDHSIKESLDASLIDKSLHGIPEYEETHKRTTVRNVLDTYGSFESIGYILPNGDAYFVEPYSSQQALTVSNFSFRDWYKNVINTHDSYVSSIIISKATNRPVTAVAVPVISQDGSLMGILAAAFDLDIIKKTLEESRSYPNERILMVDNERNIIADTEGFHETKVYLGIGAISKALVGERGTIIGTINGTKMLVAYAPIEVSQNKWIIVSIQPYDDAFHSVNLSRNESTFLIITMSSIVATAGYFLRRLAMTREKFAQKLEQSNEFLKRTQSTLVLSEERYRNLFQLSPDPIAVTDLQEFLLYCNESFEKKFGYSKDESVGKNLHDLVDEISKDALDKCHNELKITGSLNDVEIWYNKKDGTSFPALLSISVLRDRNNAPAGYIAMIKDITETKKISQYVRSLIEVSLDPLVTISPEGKITDVNEATINVTGVSRKKIIGTDFSDYFTEPDKARKGYERVFKEGFIVDYPLSIRNSSGQITDVLYNASVYKDDKGNVLGVFAAARDVTESKKAQRKIEENEKLIKSQLEKLQETDKLKDEFSSMVSHELKTPLFPIKFHSEILRDPSLKGALNKTQLESVEEIYQNATILQRLIDDILTVQKLELKKLTFDVSDVEVDRLINEVMKQNAPLMVEKQIEFVNSNMEKITIKSDPARLSQVFWNLIKNSVDFVPDKGEELRSEHKATEKTLFFM